MISDQEQDETQGDSGSGYLRIVAVAKGEGQFWLTICTDASPHSEEPYDSHDIRVPSEDLLDYVKVRAHALEQRVHVFPAIRAQYWESMISEKLEELRQGLPGLFPASRVKLCVGLVDHAREHGRNGEIRLLPLSKTFTDWPVHVRTNGTLFGPEPEIDGQPDEDTHTARRLMLRAAGFDRVFLSDKEWELVVDDEELRQSIANLAPWRNLPQ